MVVLSNYEHIHTHLVLPFFSYFFLGNYRLNEQMKRGKRLEHEEGQKGRIG